MSVDSTGHPSLDLEGAPLITHARCDLPFQQHPWTAAGRQPSCAPATQTLKLRVDVWPPPWQQPRRQRAQNGCRLILIWRRCGATFQRAVHARMRRVGHAMRPLRNMRLAMAPDDC